MNRRLLLGQGLLEVLLALLVLALATLALVQALRPGLRHPQATLQQLRAQEQLATLQEQLAALAPAGTTGNATDSAREALWSAWQGSLLAQWPQAVASRDPASDGRGWHITLRWPGPAAAPLVERAWLALPTSLGASP